MSYNGSGVFNINTAGQPVVTGTVISSSVFNALTADLATGLSTAITKDGQTTVTANIGFNGYKITNLGAGTAATDAARVGQLQAGTATVITVTGTDTYTGTMAPALAGYAAGNMFSFIVPNTNTSSCTLNIDGQGAKSITRDGSTALVAGDLVSGSEVVVIYDGTRFQVLNSNSKTNFNLSGTLTVAGNVTLSGGTTNQVQYLNGSKVLTGSSNLTFDGTTLTANALSVTNGVTFSGGTANGVVYLNGSKVATTGSALTFDGTTFGVNPNVANSTSLLVTGAYTGSGTATMLAFQRTGGAVAGAIRYNDSAGDIEFGTTTSHPLAFIYGGTEQMRLTSTGLGIGTSSPTQKLEVSGAIRATITPSNSVLASFLLANSATTSAANLQLNTSGGLAFWTYQSGGAGWFNSATLDTSGNLGLGVTPSSWISSWKAIQQQGVSLASSSTIGIVGQNWYVDSTGTDRYISSATASIYKQTGGTHAWYNAPSGTAGNAISFTQALTLNTNGALVLQGGNTSASGVGVTFPATQSASSDANTLDDYEEGTWTPVDSGGMTGFSAINGNYVKIGNLVHVRGSFSMTSVTTNIFISGLPFVSANGYYSVVYSGINVAIAFSRVEAAAQIQWNVNSTGGGNQTVNFTAWYQV